MTSTPAAKPNVPNDARPEGAGLLATVWIVLRKDVMLEWRGRARINATVFFGVLTLLIFSFAMGPDPKLLIRTAAGFLWLAIFMSSTLSLAESLRIESENDALEGLCLLPVNTRALFLGKALGNMIYLTLLSLVLLPTAVAVYDINVKMGLGAMVVTLVTGCAVIAGPGTLYAAIAVQARARDVLLPLLLFPLLVPALLASVKATELVLHGDPMGQLVSWLSLLGALAVIYWLLGTLLFSRVLQP